METGPEQIRAVQAAYSAFASGDVAALLGAFSEDAIWDATDALWTTGMFFGHDGISDYFRALDDLWEDLRLEDYEIELVRVGTLLARGRLRGRDRHSGEIADAAFVHWLDLGTDGKIKRLRILVDPDRAG